MTITTAYRDWIRADLEADQESGELVPDVDTATYAAIADEFDEAMGQRLLRYTC